MAERAAAFLTGGPLAVILLTTWAAIEFQPLRFAQIPFLLLWAAAVGSFFAGFVGTHLRVMGRASTPVLLLVGIAAAVLLVGALAVAQATPLRGAAVSTWLIGAGLAGVVVRSRWVASPSTTLLLAVQVLALWVLLDVNLVRAGVGLYDLRVYLAAGAQFADGVNPYLTAPLTALSPDPAEAGFVYPPVILPLFAVLAELPTPVVSVGWVGLLLGSALIAFRLLGASWLWAIALLACPPLVKGVASGNVANVILLLFCAGPILGWLLPASGFLKVQAAIPALWLARERRWREAALGLLMVAGICVVTLPLVGLDSWSNWLNGLALRAESQVNLPILYGWSLAQWLPFGLFAVLSVLVAVAGLWFSGPRGLAALGLASIVASPSLWPHGFLVALPAVFFLDAAWMWLALGLGVGGAWLWSLVVLGAWGVIHRRRAEGTPVPGWGLRGSHPDDAVIRPV
jgi:hypothetical protein